MNVVQILHSEQVSFFRPSHDQPGIKLGTSELFRPNKNINK